MAELRDWRGFVAGPKREQLCASIETLADDQHMAEAALDRHHRQLVKEWKALGDAAANREQSARFRHASDRIHERLAPGAHSSTPNAVPTCVAVKRSANSSKPCWPSLPKMPTRTCCVKFVTRHVFSGAITPRTTRA